MKVVSLAAMVAFVFGGCTGVNNAPPAGSHRAAGASNIVYVTADETPWSSLSRLDIRLGSSTFFAFSNVSDGEHVPWTRHTGAGILTFSENAGSYAAEQLPIFAPNGKQPSWRWEGFNCVATPKDSKVLTNCEFQRTGQVFSSLYSPERGVEWFDNSCDHGPGRKCRYVLRSPVGLFAQSWLRGPR